YTVKTFVGRLRGNAANGGTCEGKEYEARFQQPDGLAFAPNGDLWFTDRGTHEIRRVTSDKFVHKVALTGAAIKSPWGAAFSPDGYFVVANKDLKNAVKISQDGVVTEFITDLNNPIGLAYDKAGNLYICDRGNNAIKKYDSNGTLLKEYTGVAQPNAVAVDDKGRMFVVSNNAYKLFMIDTDGTVTTIFGNGIKPSAATYNNGVPGDLSAATMGISFGIVIDADGTMYISDTLFHVVRSLTPDENGDYTKGTLRTVAGTPGVTTTDPLSGDGDGVMAKFNYPAEMVIVGNTIYISDELTWSIRTITKE
ncbi:MAG: transcription factor, partial [Muribaculaceae bacterium]|nr:transcription factor [Muribaculaceae bacterium]